MSIESQNHVGCFRKYHPFTTFLVSSKMCMANSSTRKDYNRSYQDRPYTSDFLLITCYSYNHESVFEQSKYHTKHDRKEGGISVIEKTFGIETKLQISIAAKSKEN